MSKNTTPLSSRLEILSDLWMNYRGEEQFKDFLEYNDLGLPLSYAILNNIVPVTPTAERMVDETWELLLSALDIEDTGYDNLDSLFDDSDFLGE
jgi:hypothetical protein